MALPTPVPGMVIHYSYLWWEECERGQEEGVKDRPCVVITAIADSEGSTVVTVLPITHTPPGSSTPSVEIPYLTKQRLGLDAGRSWVVLTEANRFMWPGPDLRFKELGGGAEIVSYGLLPRALFKAITDKFARAIEARRAHVLRRTQ